MQKLTPASNGSSQPPAEVRDLRKVYGDVTAVDGISFTLGAWLDHGPAGRQRRGQDHHHLPC